MKTAAISHLVELLPSHGLRLRVLKYLFKRHGKRLQEFHELMSGGFFLYKIDDQYIASEDIAWNLGKELLFERAYEASLHFYKPKTGDTILDIGAGLGEEAIVYANLVGGKEKNRGRVICIEANPKVYEVLQKVIELNGLDNTTAMHLALYEKTDLVNIGTEIKGAYEATRIDINGDEATKVPAISFDDLILQLGLTGIELLKVNIEGAERYLLGMQNSNLKKINHVAIACHDFRFRKEGDPFFKTKELIKDWLTTNGFTIQSQMTGIDYIDDWIYGTRKNAEQS